VRRPALLALLLVALACSRDEPRREAPAQGRAAGAPGVVTLMPSATEVMAALGATSMLIGVDDYSEYPPEVKRLPKVGAFLSPNVEAIVRLRPSLVIVDDVHAPAAAALRDAGIATVACSLHALPDVRHALRAVGARIGKAAEAERVIREIDAALDAAAARRPARRPRVLAVIDREAGGLGGLVAAGPGSWIDELLAVVGGDNVMLASGVRYPKISLEEVLRGQPDVILDLSYAAHAEAAARGALGPWRAVDVPATRAGRVIELYRPYLVAPSPRVTQALADLGAAIARP
jgi:iron complex transport system substrate-binding protein